MCERGVHLQYSKNYLRHERWEVKSRLRYIKATKGHKAQMDVQQSMSGVQIQVPMGWCCALECWYMQVAYRLNVCKVLSGTREPSSRHTLNIRVFHRDVLGFLHISCSIVRETRDSESDWPFNT